MSTNPTDLPGRSTLVMTLPQAPLPDVLMARVRAQQDNARAVDYVIDAFFLPAPVRIPRPESVHVMVADVDDLGEWLRVLGGEIHVSPEFEGVELWTLHTQTEPREDGSTTSVLVSVPVPSGELVMDWIRRAVKR
ncbi:hypothetical protein EASAB2608_06269 [Streptomyces sp. EAS-AB2608]|uniref:hypothetical protein n=1 Tax=Streptomyces sp. EAS-AB2608 TaxID=2779671 RepID=UPI001BEDE52F|nr:hypothetical protein [Streptomyces sp. EAS-AB2608]BCM70935.1 hypothetical protein EASAB2608_06269 [Streptomyces sp. EAS-AB2608]